MKPERKPERRTGSAPRVAVDAPATASRRRPLRWFVPMPARMALDPGLSHAAFRLASLLLHYESDRGCFPSQQRLSADLGISLDSVQRYLRELELYGFLARERRYRQINRYVLVPLYEPPIGHGSFEETGQLETQNAPKRRPPSPRTLRVRRPDPELPLQPAKPAKPVKSLEAARHRRVAAANTAAEEVTAPVIAAPVRPLTETPEDPIAAPVRSDQPHRCGPNKNQHDQEHHHQEAAIESFGLSGGGGEEETLTGLGALQHIGVNVARRDLGIHEGHGRALNEAEMHAWAQWMAGSPAAGIANKAAFCAAKVRMGCTVNDVFPAIVSEAASHRRKASEATAARDEAERERVERERVEHERVERANALIAQMTPADRASLRDQALNDPGVWIARDASWVLFARLLVATERRLVLGEIEPCPVVRDHSAYPELPPL